MHRDKALLPSDLSIEVDPSARLSGAGWRHAGQGRYAAFFLACLLIHAIGVSLLFLEYRNAPPLAPPPEEIPVEILVEPPPPEPKVEPPAPPKPLDETEAHDAPREANDEKLKLDTSEEASKSPTVAPPPDKPAAAPERKQASAPSARERPQDKPDAIPLDAAAENHDKPNNAPPSPAPPKTPEKRAIFLADPFTTFQPAPEVHFSTAAKASPIAGGKANATYLSILYGMIMAHMHKPVSVSGGGIKSEGQIVFVVDAMGQVLQRRVGRPSGVPELDLAALNAVGSASPFPAPPNAMPIGLTFTYETK